MILSNKYMYNFLAFFALLLNCTVARAVSFPGFIYSGRIQVVAVNGGVDWSYKIMQMAGEGRSVKPGDMVLQVAGTNEDKYKTDFENRVMQEKISQSEKINRFKEGIVQLERDIATKEKEWQILNLDVKTENTLASSLYVSGQDLLRGKLDLEIRELQLKLAKEKLERKKKLLAINERIVEQERKTSASVIAKFIDSKKQESITANISGIIVYQLLRNSEKPTPGSVVYNGQSILSIMDEKDLFVNAYVKEEQFNKIGLGKKVDVRILGQKEVVTSGHMESISSVVLPVAAWEPSLPSSSYLARVKTFQVKIKLDVLPPEAKPSGSVVVTLDNEKS